MAHTPVKGYRELTEIELLNINDLKELAEIVGKSLDAVSVNPDVDRRWLSIGRTHLQQGFMAVIRSIARPPAF